MHGLTLRSEGAKYLCSLLSPIPEQDHEELIEKVILAVQKLPLESALISQKDIATAAKDVAEAESEEPEILLQVVPTDRVPRLEFSVERNKFVVAAAASTKLHGDAKDKALLFRNRYNTVYQRTRQHKLFRAPPAGTPAHLVKHFGLTKVEFLVGGGGGSDGEVVVLGMLTLLVEGQLHLEDDTGAVPVNTENVKFHTGLFPHNCLVLVEGTYEDGILHAEAIGLPPHEHPDTTRALLGNVNYFGGPGSGCAKYCAKLQAAQGKREAMFVILSDVWLDKIPVTSKLQELFSGYSSFPPTAFILCGNFLSSCHTAHQVEELRQSLTSLGDTIAQFPDLVAKSRFLFVPGPNDPGPGSVYPRPPLPSHLTEGLRRKVPSAEFVSNPCRLLYCTQEMVILREDIMTKMCRNCIFFPTNAEDIPSHFGKTLVSQAHLAPLPLNVVPTYWGLDHCLSLHPTPDFIVVADRADPFTTTINGATITNPGSFLKTDFSFKVYFPNRNVVEDSQIGDSGEAQ